MTERVTITVESSLEHGERLSVRDAMLQVLDFFDVLIAAASDDARSQIEWRLVEATMNSPFTATAEAVAADPEFPAVDMFAREAKTRARHALDALATQTALPEWVGTDTKGKLVRLFKRNLNGVGRTVARLDDNNPVVIVERTARVALQTLELLEASNRPPDRSGEELGSVEAHVIDATTFHGKPALRLRERLTGDRITCVLSDELATRAGGHTWSEVWSGERVLAAGRIKRDVDGRTTLVKAETLDVIKPVKADLSLLISSAVAGDLPPHAHIDDMWDD